MISAPVTPVVAIVLMGISCVVVKPGIVLVVCVARTAVDAALLAVVAVLVLPEYLLTSANRARWLPPSAFAYVFSDSLAAVVGWVNRSQHWAAGHLVQAVRAIPGVVVAIPSALITLVWSAGLLS